MTNIKQVIIGNTTYPIEDTQARTDVATKSTVSVSATGTTSDSIQYITVDGVEKKILAESIPVYEEEPEPSAVAEGEVFATPDGDDVSVQQVIFDVTYPVGFVFIQHSSTDNPTTLWQSLGIQATWTDCTSEFANRYEMASTGNNAGTQLAEQLPNITGELGGSRLGQYYSGMTKTGAFSATTSQDNYGAGVHEGLPSLKINFNAHNGNSVYTDNGVVRPLTTTVKYWRRTA